MRLGIFGGTFDPVHYGHLLLAETCRQQCRLNHVWFVPAAVPPHKQEEQLTEAARRVDMLRLAIAGHLSFAVADLEVKRGGVSYTVETLEEIQRTVPDAELFLLMGGDSIRDLPTWRDPARICDLATPVVVQRRDAPEIDWSVLRKFVEPDRLAAMSQYKVDMPVIELSSTAIRDAIRAGKSIRFQTPRAVEQYIENHGLYQ